MQTSLASYIAIANVQASVAQKVYSAILDQVNHYPVDNYDKNNWVIHWIVIYLAESIIHPLNNNWGQNKKQTIQQQKNNYIDKLIPTRQYLDVKWRYLFASLLEDIWSQFNGTVHCITAV